MKYIILLAGVFGMILNASAADFNCADVQSREQDQTEISNLQTQIEHVDIEEGGWITLGVTAEVAAVLGTGGLVAVYEGAIADPVATGAVTMITVLTAGGSAAAGVAAFISAHDPIDQKRVLKEKLQLAQEELSSCSN